MSDNDKPIRSMSCCTCGRGCRGRQWWNRDTGFGLCAKCGDWLSTRGEDPERMAGKRGIHWDVSEGADDSTIVQADRIPGVRS
jgi:hypothetical protein